MIGRADLDAAIAARLCDIPGEIAKEAAGAIYGEWVRHTHQPPHENAPGVILERLGVPATRNPSAVWHALLALGAEIAGDAEVYFPAAFLVFEAHRQAERARLRDTGDALAELLRALIAERPEFSPAMLWSECRQRATEGGDAVLADYDPCVDAISYEPHPGAPLKDIGVVAFRRRVQRLMRREPASVAPGRDTARNRKAA